MIPYFGKIFDFFKFEVWHFRIYSIFHGLFFQDAKDAKEEDHFCRTLAIMKRFGKDR